MKSIPVSRASIGPLEREYVLDAVESGWISGQGPYVERFENDWARVCGTTHAAAVSSGTAALHLLLLALSVQRGDEVIVPALTYAAVANAVLHAGGVPIVVDIDPATWCLSSDAVAAAITPRSAGIVAVHSYGHPADMSEITALARRNGLWVIEDGAQAHLGRYRGQPVGGLASGAAFSFFANKVVTTGEGGAVTTNDAELIRRVKALRHQGVTASDDRYRPSLAGLGLRMGNLAAAIGCAQVARVDELIAKRRAIVACYEHLLVTPDLIEAQPRSPWAETSPWLYSILLRPGRAGWTPGAVSEALAERGIETRPLFPPLSSLPACAGSGGDCPEARRLSAQGISLPLYPELEPGDIAYITATIRSCA
jgi:perosamine synthetase